jgi:hypothetical protein
MTVRVRQFFLLSALAASLCAAADAPLPPKQFVPPIPEMPFVLYFDDFDSPSAVSCMTVGTVENAPDPAAGKALQCVEVTFKSDKSSKKGSAAVFEFNRIGLRMPDGKPPISFSLRFSVWAEEPGELQLTFEGKAKYSAVFPLKTVGKWTPIALKFSELKSLSAHQEEVFGKLQIGYLPTEDKVKKVFIDDMLLTYGGPSAGDVLKAIQELHKTAKDSERTREKDGFTFSLKTPEVAPASTGSRGAKKSKTVQIFASHPGDGPAYVKALNAAFAAAKLSGYTFVPADTPDGSPFGGIADMRTLAKDNLDRSQARYALLLLSYADARSQNVEPLRIVLDRILRWGSVPVVVVPPPLAHIAEPDKTTFQNYADAVAGLCAPRGVTVVEAAAALKDTSAPLTDGELNADGIKAVAGLTSVALRHIETYLPKRK